MPEAAIGILLHSTPPLLREADEELKIQLLPYEVFQGRFTQAIVSQCLLKPRRTAGLAPHEVHLLPDLRICRADKARQVHFALHQPQPDQPLDDFPIALG